MQTGIFAGSCGCGHENQRSSAYPSARRAYNALIAVLALCSSVHASPIIFDSTGNHITETYDSAMQYSTLTQPDTGSGRLRFGGSPSVESLWYVSPPTYNSYQTHSGFWDATFTPMPGYMMTAANYLDYAAVLQGAGTITVRVTEYNLGNALIYDQTKTASNGGGDYGLGELPNSKFTGLPMPADGARFHADITTSADPFPYSWARLGGFEINLAAVVPEPASMSILAFGAVGFMGRGRRKKG